MYPNSMQQAGTSTLYLDRSGNEKILVVRGRGEIFDSLQGRETIVDSLPAKICTLNHGNAVVIRDCLAYTRPVANKGGGISMGLGDRLGLASAGHIRAIRGTGVFPVLAQQSMRELNLTGRTYPDVLDAATWAVFQERYTQGYGADGDHLKTAEQVKYALDSGYTMITLDCSDQIGERCEVTEDLKQAYLGREFEAGTVSISFTEEELSRIVAVYYGAIKHTATIYHDMIQGRDVDFEMSVDETTFTTTPQAHFFIASELQRKGVWVHSLAPRFCGEFQKGIDYIGSVEEFRGEFDVHARIARHFGYRLSVHSGSDKFAVFPAVGTLDAYHLKTAGTSWLEALRVVAQKDPALFREILEYALMFLADAKKIYHTTENTKNIPAGLADEELPQLLNQSDARQVLHITYGFVLDRFKDRLYAALARFEEEYMDALHQHIGKHLSALGIAGNT